MYIEHAKLGDTEYAILEKKNPFQVGCLSGHCLSKLGIDP